MKDIRISFQKTALVAAVVSGLSACAEPVPEPIGPPGTYAWSGAGYAPADYYWPNYYYGYPAYYSAPAYYYPPPAFYGSFFFSSRFGHHGGGGHRGGHRR